MSHFITPAASLTLRFPVLGMTCDSCVSRVEKALHKVPGVQAATVNLATESVTLETGPDFALADAHAAVERAGYQIGSNSVNLGIQGMTCASCVTRVEKALLAVPGVLSASVNLATETARVAVSAGSDVQPLLDAVGQQVYLANCASCHGGKLEGQPNWRERNSLGMLPAPPHDASGHTWHHPDDMLFALTKYGVAKVANMPDYQSAMPAFDGRLSDADILAALSWIKSQWPDDIRAQHDAVNERAKKD